MRKKVLYQDEYSTPLYNRIPYQNSLQQPRIYQEASKRRSDIGMQDRERIIHSNATIAKIHQAEGSAIISGDL